MGAPGSPWLVRLEDGPAGRAGMVVRYRPRSGHQAIVRLDRTAPLPERFLIQERTSYEMPGLLQ